jgi:hypothetical protein
VFESSIDDWPLAGRLGLQLTGKIDILRAHSLVELSIPIGA